MMAIVAAMLFAVTIFGGDFFSLADSFGSDERSSL